LITAALVIDQSAFNKTAIEWKQMVTVTSHIDKIQSSQDMTDLGIAMFAEHNKNATAVRRQAALITSSLFFKHGIIRLEAIEYLKSRLSKGVTCVISTASYEDGARGFVDGLVDCGLLPKELAGKIVFTGTVVNWQIGKVAHMNVDTQKLRGLETALGKPLSEIRPKINAIFGDDPAINDRALLDGLCSHSFVIPNSKNQTMKLPAACVFSTWSNILSHQDDLASFHRSLTGSSSTCVM
jgi:hypothetical protein